MHPFDAVVPELPSQFAAGKVGSAAASGPLPNPGDRRVYCVGCPL